MSTTIIAPVRMSELREAFELVCAASTEPSSAERVAHLHDLVAAGEIDPRGIFVARRDGAIISVFVCLAMPGASGLVWPPCGDASTFESLVAAGLAWLTSRGTKLVQAIVAAADEASLEPLQRVGFRAAGPMFFFRHHVEPAHLRADRPELNLMPLASAGLDVFAGTLERTYEGTHDFPELAGVRSIFEVIAAYKANPHFREEHSRLAMVRGEPAGILLLSEVEPFETWDLSYLGVVPEQRGHGLGTALVAAAIDIVYDAGGERLDVAVDSRNGPAIQLYQRLGFQLLGERLVSLRILGCDAENGGKPTLPIDCGEPAN
jgi:mycothiol synthase